MYTDVYRYIYRAFPVDSVVKNCLQCRSLRFDPRAGKKKGRATHSSILAWRTPWTEEPGGLQSIGSKSWTRLRLSMSARTHIYITYTLDCNLHLSYCYILSTHGREWNWVGNFFPTPWVSMWRGLQWTHTSASCRIGPHFSTECR